MICAAYLPGGIGERRGLVESGLTSEGGWTPSRTGWGLEELRRAEVAGRARLQVGEGRAPERPGWERAAAQDSRAGQQPGGVEQDVEAHEDGRQALGIPRSLECRLGAG